MFYVLFFNVALFLNVDSSLVLNNLAYFKSLVDTVFLFLFMRNPRNLVWIAWAYEETEPSFPTF